MGIIPAYAGSTSTLSGSTAFAGDHPRVCGEHSPSASLDTAKMGSSPRMRGAHGVHVRYRGHLGIIPAYAGSTAPGWPALDVSWDHPRVCGEHEQWKISESLRTGSSPRMRGAQKTGTLTKTLEGIIPAYAGSTGS